MTRIAILAFDGADELDVVGPFEVLQPAAPDADIELRLFSVSGRPEIVAQHGLRLRTEGQVDGRPDIIVVPGGGWVGKAPAGIRTEIARSALPIVIEDLHAQGTIVATVCTGAMVLAASGLANGRRMTTHHDAIEDLRPAGAQIVSECVVDDGDIVSSGGVTSGIDLALHLVSRITGDAALATTIAEHMGVFAQRVTSSRARGSRRCHRERVERSPSLSRYDDAGFSLRITAQ
ncbi:MAG: DJ-1/PfpI family protein [Vulcanimicrobiaceae bacterium]